ncbi:MAG: hypothetical protein QW559_01290 [Candidatus Woesearchaeota archaeon]
MLQNPSNIKACIVEDACAGALKLEDILSAIAKKELTFSDVEHILSKISEKELYLPLNLLIEKAKGYAQTSSEEVYSSGGFYDFHANSDELDAYFSFCAENLLSKLPYCRKTARNFDDFLELVKKKIEMIP